MKLRDIPKIVLADSRTPLSATEIWAEAIKLGLDKTVKSKGKTPDASIGAFLYTQAKRPQSGIISEGSRPVRFRLAEDVAVPKEKSRKGQESKFLQPCLEVLKAHSPSAMGVSEIIKEVLAQHAELPWSKSNGAVRAALLRSADRGNGICKVKDSIPPKFFFDDKSVPLRSVPLIREETPPKNADNKQPGESAKSFSFLKCAEKVLREFGGKNAMHYRDITKKAIELGWLVSDGATPEATMSAQLATDINKRTSLGKPPFFIRHGRGYFGLAEWMDPILSDIKQHNEKVCEQLLSNLRTMPPVEFEKLIGRLLDEMDFLDTNVTNASGDGGIDVRGTWRISDGIEIRMAIQVKRWKSNVQAPIVQAVRGALTSEERGMIITTSDFSKGARDEANDPKKACTISLVNGEQLVKLLVQYGIGVKRKNVEILELDDNFSVTTPPDSHTNA